MSFLWIQTAPRHATSLRHSVTGHSSAKHLDIPGGRDQRLGAGASFTRAAAERAAPVPADDRTIRLCRAAP